MLVVVAPRVLEQQVERVLQDRDVVRFALLLRRVIMRDAVLVVQQREVLQELEDLDPAGGVEQVCSIIKRVRSTS